MDIHAKDDSNTTDPFAYLERNCFTSEKYKIEVRGLPKFYGVGVSNTGMFLPGREQFSTSCILVLLTLNISIGI